MSDLKQELNTELSRLIRSYEERGLSSEEIGDSLNWHSELARARSRNGHVTLKADD